MIDRDPWLGPFREKLRQRFQQYERVKTRLLQAGESSDLPARSLASFANGHKYFGFNRGGSNGANGIWYREWAPGAERLSLIGDFNQWNREATPLQRDQFGVWSVFLPDRPTGPALAHDERVKVHVRSAAGASDRIPAYIRRVTFDEHGANATGRYWETDGHTWKHPRPVAISGVRTARPRIYESHAGMAQEAEKIGSFAEFRELILPRIAKAGYNAVQLMAVQEHPYYGSFGYHVSSFFAVSSRFGTPDDFKHLVDAAHGLGLSVYLDLVHSHAVKNTIEGLNLFDGTDYQYFHTGPLGLHPAWDSILFDYSKWEVLRFLLSNVRYWLEEFNIDGFRFDGVTSMIYRDHGLGKAFTSYDDYFGANVDDDAVTYLKLANDVAHEVLPSVVTIAEDVSGMAGMARPTSEGGLGFDFRLAMGIPDYWIKILKERRDEDWHMGELFHTLTNRRAHENHIAYAESHDQALVGDKTLAFRLMDAEMYTHMSKSTPSLVIDRGIALHKLIRLLTFFLGGEGWLSFMGNEFGHPEWIDFPREGNNFSCKYARRQWSLADNPLLRYGDLAAFDRALMKLDDRFGILAAPPARAMQVDELGKCLVFERAGLVVAANLNPEYSRTDWRVGVPPSMPNRVPFTAILNTDDTAFGGHGLVQKMFYPGQPVSWDGFQQSVQIYVPARTAQVILPS
ncbi:MAG: alpha amylase C-terminal domain-containing protein [Planctomycetes bacterium]|nr:alpha amylase C-terminal domain-containing protein [Planctomycetota bacterium]